MTYPFVPAAAQFGPRKGPVKAFAVHMAEGGGTVGFLSRPNRRNVSVHYVIERTGRIVQMVKETMATGSINPNDLRTTDDPAVFGASVRKAVMGEWDHDPNSAVISVEIEGYALSGPNAAQAGSLRTLVEDVRSRYPDMGILGHRDFQDYKRCPGPLIPWSDIGGHGPASTQGGSDVRFANSNGRGTTSGQRLALPSGTAWLYLDGTPGGKLSQAQSAAVLATADSRPGEYLVEIRTGAPYADSVTRETVVLVKTVIVPSAVPATTDCADAVAAEHERVRAAAIKAAEAL
jgi:hypothetical protein